MPEPVPAVVTAPVPVLEIGGTHVTGAIVDPAAWRVVARQRLALDADAGADDLIARFAAAALDAPAGAVWGVAMPDPFDYARGIGRFEGVGKFTSLYGVDVRAALLAALPGPPAGLRFLNDADAFVLGEWTAGAAAGAARCAGLTLGTGVGSGWLVDGVPSDPGLPPGGRIHRMHVDGRPLEDVVSRRAIRRTWDEAGGDPAADVREIAAAARAGDTLAVRVLAAAFGSLGRVVGECLAGFAADVLVVGGSMAASWDVLGPPLLGGATAVLGDAMPPVRLSADADTSAVLGAAAYAASPAAGST